MIDIITYSMIVCSALYIGWRVARDFIWPPAFRAFTLWYCKRIRLDNDKQERMINDMKAAMTPEERERQRVLEREMRERMRSYHQAQIQKLDWEDARDD